MADAIAIAEKSLLVFFMCCSSVSYRRLVLLIGILLFSESVTATATTTSVAIAQQPAISSPNPTTTQQQPASARAEALNKEALQLSNQGTAESKQQALVKYQEALSIWQQLAVNEAPPYVARDWAATNYPNARKSKPQQSSSISS